MVKFFFSSMKSVLSQNKFRLFAENNSFQFSCKSSTIKVFQDSKFVLFSLHKLSISVLKPILLILLY